MIKNLVDDDPILHRDFLQAKRESEAQSVSMRTSGRYPFNGRGDVNTYTVFAELFRSLTGPHGRSGVIVPTGIATDATTQYFFKDLVETSTIAALYDFENAKPLFDGVHRSFKFCLLTMAGRLAKEETASFAFFLHDPADIAVSEFDLSPDEIKLINPNTGTLPIFRTRRDAEITLGIYQRVPVLINENDPINGNPWEVSFMTMFHMSNDSHLFRTREQLENDGWLLTGNVFERVLNGKIEKMLPLYEAKMIHQFDHRWATYEGIDVRYVTDSEKRDAMFEPFSRYWVPDMVVSASLPDNFSGSALLGIRDITNSTNERTVITSVFPSSGVGNNLPVMFVEKGSPLLLSSCLNSFVLDFVSRPKVGGVHLNFFIANQLAVLSPATFEKISNFDTRSTYADWLMNRVIELTDSTYLKTSSLDNVSDHGPFNWDSERREAIRTELDAAFFHLYGVNRDDVSYIMDTFPIVKRKDEAAFGEYRTKRLILEAYDAMREAINTGIPFESTLNPPPGQGLRHAAMETVS